MNELTASNQSTKKKKPWLLWGCLGCSSLVALMLVLVAVIGTIVIGSIKSSTPYQQALESTGQSHSVRQALGDPLTAGWWVIGSIQLEGSTGDANFSFPISGPKGSGKIDVEARKHAGEWHLDLLLVSIDESEERIDVLTELEGSSQLTIEEFLDATAEGDLEKAHDYFSRPLKDVQDYDAFAQVAAANSALFRITEIQLSKSIGEHGPHYEGSLLLESGGRAIASFDLIRELGEWRLLAYEISHQNGGG